MGYLGWSVDQFWDATPRELINAYRGKSKAEENRFKQEQELNRIYTTLIVNTQLKKGVKAKDIITFPWEVAKTSKADKLKKLRSV